MECSCGQNWTDEYCPRHGYLKRCNEKHDGRKLEAELRSANDRIRDLERQLRARSSDEAVAKREFHPGECDTGCGCEVPAQDADATWTLDKIRDVAIDQANFKSAKEVDAQDALVAKCEKHGVALDLCCRTQTQQERARWDGSTQGDDAEYGGEDKA